MKTTFSFLKIGKGRGRGQNKRHATQCRAHAARGLHARGLEGGTRHAACVRGVSIVESQAAGVGNASPWIQSQSESKEPECPAGNLEDSEQRRLTRGCQFSYCFCKFAPMVSRAFCGPIDRGSAEATEGEVFKRAFLPLLTLPEFPLPQPTSNHL